MDWLKIILAGLSLIDKITDWALQRKYINEGQMIQIAKAQAEILRKSDYAKQALAEFTRRSESDVDDFLRGLGGDGSDSK